MNKIMTADNATKATLMATMVTLISTGGPIAIAGANAQNWFQFAMGAALIVLGGIVYAIKAAMFGVEATDDDQVIDVVKPIIEDAVTDIKKDADKK